jgi:thiosulfate/3-mercaptopyruvate sulfurtransferase
MKKVRRSFLRLSALVACISLSFSCATKPTKAYENQQRQMKPAAAGELAGEQIVLTEQTIVLDARAPFEYSLSHIPRAINVQWTDFTQKEEAYRGVLLADRFELTRRLARLGIAQNSEVVVVGKGLSGGGEEGRLAWTLAYLGLDNVRAVPISYFKGHVSNIEAKPLPPAVIWKPVIDESLLVTRQELLYVLDNRGVYDPISYGEKARPRLYKIIDVRTSREYLGKEGVGMQTPIPNMEAINIPWNEFFDPTGRANPEIAQRLHEVGVTKDQRIILISDDGLRSAAVTMALRSMGFKGAGNYAGGLKELVASAGKRRR